MGILRDTFSQIGSTGSTLASASSGVPLAAGPAFQQSLYATQAGTTLAMTGEALQGLGTLGAGLYQAKVAERNAKLADMNANANLVAGQDAETMRKMRTSEVIAQGKANEAASGIDVASGSTQRVATASRDLGDMDALAIRYNAARAAFGDRISAATFRANAETDRQAGVAGFAKGLFGAEASYISGASSLSNKWLQYQLDEAPH